MLNDLSYKKEDIRKMKSELSNEEVPVVDYGFAIAKMIPYDVKNIRYDHRLDMTGNLKSCCFKILMEPSSGCPCSNIFVNYEASRDYYYVTFLATSDYSYDRKLLKLAKAINYDEIEITDMSVSSAVKNILNVVDDWAAEAKKIEMKRSASPTRRSRKTIW